MLLRSRIILTRMLQQPARLPSHWSVAQQVRHFSNDQTPAADALARKLAAYQTVGPKPADVPQEVHDKAQELAPKVTALYHSSTDDVSQLYKSYDGRVYDELMRILNHNEPYVIRDVVAGKQSDGCFDFPRDSRVLDIGCGTGIFGKLLNNEGFTDITGVDGCANMLKYAEENGTYRKLYCRLLGVGVEKFPDELKNQFDVVAACGIWVVNHVPKEAMLDCHASLKLGGHFVTAMRSLYWENGEPCGYKDIIDQLIADGKLEKVKEVKFIRGISSIDKDKLYNPQEAVMVALKKTA